jgi:hypothetical protein
MQFLFAVIIGAATALCSLLLHQSIPPVGVLASLLFTYLAIWQVGRAMGARKYKVAASIGWVAVTIRAGTFGVGQELIVQGDFVGSALFLFGTLLLFAAIAARV